MELDGVAAGTSLSSGFPRLDECGGVLQRGKVTVLVGAPSMGKSALAMAMVLAASEPAGTAGAYFTSFYENGDLILRLLASTWGVRPARSSQRRHGIAVFAEQARERGLHLFQGGGLVRPCEVIRQRAHEALALSPGLAVLAVDPLLTYTPNMRDGASERRRTLAGMAVLAGELNVAVLLVATLPSASLKVADKRPRLEHLGLLGMSFEHVDTALLLHRPVAYTPRAPPELAELRVYTTEGEEPRLVSLRYRVSAGMFASAR